MAKYVNKANGMLKHKFYVTKAKGIILRVQKRIFNSWKEGLVSHEVTSKWTQYNNVLRIIFDTELYK
jgi:hypothetical protein